MATNVDDFEEFHHKLRNNDDRSESEEPSPTSNNLDILIQHLTKRDALLERLVDKLTVGTTPMSTTSNSTSVIPNLFQKIPDFDGEPNKAQTWLNDLEGVQILHSLPDNYIFETARTRLVGGAKYWYEMKRREISTWDDFMQKFTDTFIIAEDTSSK